LLGGRLVLSAAHVVCPGGRPVVRVQVRDESGLVAARVAWHRWDDEVDVAVLEIIVIGVGSAGVAASGAVGSAGHHPGRPGL
jgi:hypothetical protein